MENTLKRKTTENPEGLDRLKEVFVDIDQCVLVTLLEEHEGKVEETINYIISHPTCSEDTKEKSSKCIDNSDDASYALALQLQEEPEKTTVPKSLSPPKCSMVPLEHGVVLFKNCLSEDEQVAIYQMVYDVATQQKTTQNLHVPHKGTHPISLASYNWVHSPNSGNVPKPKELLDWGKATYERAKQYAKSDFLWDMQSEDSDLQIPTTFSPEYLLSILYPVHGKLQGHTDGGLGWVLSVTIGNSAMFFYSKSEKDAKMSIRLDSGDVILFNGGKLWHGVTDILPNTAPKCWEDLPHGKFARFNLQFRDPNPQKRL